MRKVLFVLICIGMFLLTGCGRKQALNKDEFSAKMTDFEFNISDVSNQFSKYSQIKSSTIAYNSQYQIEFYELIDDDYAKSMFNTNKDIFVRAKTSINSETSISLKNYEKYSLSNNGKYQSVVRINNTIIYLNVNSKYKKEVQNIVKKLGY